MEKERQMKKTIKKLAALLLAGALAATAALPAFAADDTYEITIAAQSTAGKSTAGNTYKAYQIFKGDLDGTTLSNITWGDDVDGAAVITALKKYDSDTFGEVTDAAGVAKAISDASKYANDAAATQALADIFYKNLGENAVADTQNEGVISDLAAGYYLVVSDETSAGSAATRNILQVIKDETITPKFDVPSIEKKIFEDGTEKTNNDAAIGDTITYHLNSVMPDMTGYDNYIFIMRDTLSDGLDYKDVKEVKIGNTVLEKGTDYYVTTFDGDASGTGNKVAYGDEDATLSKDSRKIAIVFKHFIGRTEEAGTKIVATLEAILNENAKIETETNPNEVDLIYSNNPNYEGDGTPHDTPDSTEPVGETPDSKVETLTTQIKLTKIDGDIKLYEKEALKTAEFTLTGDALNTVKLTSTESFTRDDKGIYYKLKDGSYTMTVPGETVNGKVVSEDKYESTTEKYSKTTVYETKKYAENGNKIVVQVNADTGEITFTGLKEGTYTLSETKTPAGYNTAPDVVINVTYDENSKTFTAKIGDKTLSKDAENYFPTTVENYKGSTLPSTGGMGTTIFYVIGGILVLAAVIVLISKRRVQQ